MSKHTPGPWKIVDAWNYYMVEGQNDEEIIWQDGPYQTPTINKANACLIAAAPDLLEALEQTLQLAIDWEDEARGTWQDEALGFSHNDDPIIKKARAAIANAKGEA